jgi:hypothetical protein
LPLFSESDRRLEDVEKVDYMDGWMASRRCLVKLDGQEVFNL